MKILLVNHGLPSRNSNGGPMTVWSIMTTAVQLGHQLELLVIKYAEDPYYSDELISEIESIGIKIHIVHFNPKQVVRTKNGFFTKILNKIGVQPKCFSEVFPTVRLAGEMMRICDSSEAEIIIGYHWDSMAPLVRYKNKPMLGTFGDPWHHPTVRRWEFDLHPIGRKQKLNRYLYVKACISGMKRILRSCRGAGCFQAKEVESLIRQGAPKSFKYYRTPLFDPNKKASIDNERAVFLLGPSNLEVTSTRAGLVYFAKEIFPRFLKKAGEREFELRIVGDGNLPDEFEPFLQDSRVIRCGRVAPPDDEFMQATAQLVPTPFVLGVRVRIITGMSFGCCIVTTNHEKANIPELEDGENCLLCPDADVFSDRMIELLENPSVAKPIGKNAKKTFEVKFRQDVAAKTIVDDAERLLAKS